MFGPAIGLGVCVINIRGFDLTDAAVRMEGDRDLYSGLIRLHVLHHAVEGPILDSVPLKNLDGTDIKSAPAQEPR